MGSGQGPRASDPVEANGRVVSRGDLERSCGVCGRPQDVLDLGGFRQRVQERCASCGQRSARCLGGRRLARVPGLLRRPLGVPGRSRSAFVLSDPPRKGVRGVDGCSWPSVAWVCAFEDRQRWTRAVHCESGDRTEIGRGQLDSARSIRHKMMLLSHPRRRSVSSRRPTSKCRYACAGHRGRARGSRLGAGLAATGTHLALQSRPRRRARRLGRP